MPNSALKWVLHGNIGAFNILTVRDIESRSLHEIGGCAESLGWIGDYLVAGTLHSVVVCKVEEDGSLTPVASESAHRRGSQARLRILNGVAAGPENRVLCANWNFMDVYQLKDSASSGQADINCSTQRIRFPGSGGRETVTVTNNGGGPLVISSVASSHDSFEATYTGGTLSPGESTSFEIVFRGGAASGVVTLWSNDPDENPLPVQVFGTTSFLDPGEPAVDFALPALRWNPEQEGLVEELFTLSEHRGRVVWFTVFATW